MSSPSKPPEPAPATWSLDDTIDVVCDAFEAALRAGGHPNLYQFLERVGEDRRGQLFVELLYVEFELRPPPAGEDPQDFYLAKYPAFADQIRVMSFSRELHETVHYAAAEETAQRPRSFSRF